MSTTASNHEGIEILIEFFTSYRMCIVMLDEVLDNPCIVFPKTILPCFMRLFIKSKPVEQQQSSPPALRLHGH